MGGAANSRFSRSDYCSPDLPGAASGGRQFSKSVFRLPGVDAAFPRPVRILAPYPEPPAEATRNAVTSPAPNSQLIRIRDPVAGRSMLRDYRVVDRPPRSFKFSPTCTNESFAVPGGASEIDVCAAPGRARAEVRRKFASPNRQRPIAGNAEVVAGSNSLPMAVLLQSAVASTDRQGPEGLHSNASSTRLVFEIGSEHLRRPVQAVASSRHAGLRDEQG